MKSKNKTILLAGLILFLVAAPFLVEAQGIVNCGLRDQGPTGACKPSHFYEIVYRIVNYLIGMAGFVAIFFIVWGGVQMLISAGNTSKVQEAKTTVWNAILGLVLTLIAYLIVGFVVGLLLPGLGGNPLEGLRGYLPKL